MRIVICWPGISGYLAAGCRALAAHPGLEVFLVASDQVDSNAPYEQETLAEGLSWHRIKQKHFNEPEAIRKIVADLKPDSVGIAGWHKPAFRALRYAPELAGCRFVLGLDTPWRGDLRQRLGAFRIGRWVRSMDHVVVSTERSFQYMRYLGVPEGKITRGIYCCDAKAFIEARTQKMATDPVWPKKFLFVGRYASVKGIDTMLAGYARYRTMVDEPWGLSCMGRGPKGDQIQQAENVTDLGFVQPDDQPAKYAEHGAFVLCSTYEPFGIVLPEALSSGMPVICTESVAAAVHLVPQFYTGVTFATGDAEAFARGLLWAHHEYDNLPAMVPRCQAFGLAFDVDVWAKRWLAALKGT